jgi:hypothetical protein
MPRGGLSSDPEKRRRQLEGLQRGAELSAERAKARLAELDSAPSDKPESEPAPPKRRSRAKRADSPAKTDKVDYSKAGQSRPAAKPRQSAKAKPGKARSRSASSAAKTPKREPAVKPGNGDELPGFLDGLRRPFERTYG